MDPDPGFKQPVTRWFRGRFDEVAAILPRFERRPFAVGGEASTGNQANRLPMT